MQKQGVWVIWIGSAAAAVFGGGWVSVVGQWLFGVTAVVHAIEFAVKRPIFERAGGSMGHHFVQTMIYGLFHWKPLEEALVADESGSGSAAGS